MSQAYNQSFLSTKDLTDFSWHELDDSYLIVFVFDKIIFGNFVDIF